MKQLISLVLIFPALSGAFAQKSYEHTSEYIVAVLDQSQMLATGNDVTLGKTMTDANLSPGGQGFHFLHTESGDYRVEAPVNSGRLFVAAMGTPRYQRAPVIHNKWFLDNVQPGYEGVVQLSLLQP